MDMISTLRTDLKIERGREAAANRNKIQQHAANDMIVKPLEHIKKDIIHLQEKQLLNNRVREQLAEKQRRIVEVQKEYQDIEWQYEVRL